MPSRKNIFSSVISCLAIVLAGCTLPTATPILDEPVRVLDYYVSTSGSDSNDCLSEATACLTLYRALSRSTPLGIIHIGPGEFRRTAGWQLPRHDLTIIGAGADQTILTSDRGIILQIADPARIEIRDLAVMGADREEFARPAIEARYGVQLILENCRILGKYYGLNLWSGSSATVRNCTFENNYYALENHGDLTLTASTFSGNLIGLDNGGSAQVEATAFDGNGTFDASSGASTTAVTNYGTGELTMRGGNISSTVGYGLLVNGGTVTIESVTVDQNAGTGIWQRQGSLTILASVISDNAVYGVAVGGQSGVTDTARVNISQSAILRNGSSGLRIDGGEIHVQNSTISGNRASTSGGGGIWGYGGDLFLLDSTVAYNTGSGLELGADGSLSPANITTRRSVVALNSGAECQLDPSTTFSAGVFAIFVCNESWTPETLKLRPLVADAGTFVHPIDADSPLVDASGPPATCPSADQRGFPRPAGSTCDVGAYEYGSASAAFVIATPGESDIIPLSTEPPTSPEFILIIQVPANCRQGPGVAYAVVNSALPGEQVQVIGKSADGTWWYSKVENDKCFISNIAGIPPGDLSLLSIIPAPPPPVATEPPVEEEPTDEVVVDPDHDLDGYPASVDCNDNNAKIHPGAAETPKDGVDSNCNGDDDK